jgi:hypothetical protein
VAASSSSRRERSAQPAVCARCTAVHGGASWACVRGGATRLTFAHRRRRVADALERRGESDLTGREAADRLVREDAAEPVGAARAGAHAEPARKHRRARRAAYVEAGVPRGEAHASVR